MSNIVKLNFGGEEVDAEIIEVNQSSEKWNDYFLDDGTTLKVKLVVQKVFRVIGKFDHEGNPVYIFYSTNISATNSPGSLKKK